MVQEVTGVAGVVEIWQEVVGHTLSPARRSEFLSRPEVADLAECIPYLLRSAGHSLMRERGELLLSSWLAHIPAARLRMRDAGRDRDIEESRAAETAPARGPGLGNSPPSAGLEHT